MPFESLSCRYIINIPSFPQRWLPLIYLYDPDLPLFPIYYFHVLPDNLSRPRPLDNERAYGYVEKASLTGNEIEITIVCNKDLDDPANQDYLTPVIEAVCERFGLRNPVTREDIRNVFSPPLNNANAVLTEIWQRVISNTYNDLLPFGKLWDEVLGLTRFVASWNSPSGRKGELVQTHYFLSKFGVKIQSSGSIPPVDFYLLPTIQELTDINNPLTGFPQYADLVQVAGLIQNNYCSLIKVGDIRLSKFRNPYGGKLNTEKILDILNGSSMPHRYRSLAVECFNTFDKGPQRTIMFLIMLDDIRNGRLNPSILNSSQLGSIYDGLARTSTYQSPKVIHIYAQQSFGNQSAMPIDTWIGTFFKWPLSIYPHGKNRDHYHYIFSNSRNLGKVERLLWVTSQARKVHSSACNDALWCIKYSSTGKPRGANPLSCNICMDAIRNCCPAFVRIRNERVCFNSNRTGGTAFEIKTSAQNNSTPNQAFIHCTGKSIYNEIFDDFSPADNPDGFAPFPDPHHNGTVITVDDFVRIY